VDLLLLSSTNLNPHLVAHHFNPEVLFLLLPCTNQLSCVFKKALFQFTPHFLVQPWAFM
jgi:hypothetical protein